MLESRVDIIEVDGTEINVEQLTRGRAKQIRGFVVLGKELRDYSKVFGFSTAERMEAWMKERDLPIDDYAAIEKTICAKLKESKKDYMDMAERTRKRRKDVCEKNNININKLEDIERYLKMKDPSKPGTSQTTLLYSNINFGGDEFEIKAGEYWPDLSLGGFNNRASSVVCHAASYCILWDYTHRGGIPLYLVPEEQIIDLGDIPGPPYFFDNMASSAYEK